MSRLDQHVSKVQNKLALARFVVALSWTLLFAAAAVTVGILIDRAFHVRPPKYMWFIYGATGAAFVVALVYAIVRRPSAKSAAVAIDEKLGLKEKISTALFLRSSASDPFEVAAVKDAEDTAQRVVVESRRHFPLTFPRIGYGAIIAIALCFAALLVPSMDLFGREEQQKKVAMETQQRTNAENAVKKALAVVEAVPKGVANADAIRNAKIELHNLLDHKISDPQSANRTALKALQDAQEALKQQTKANEKFAEAQNEMKMMRNLGPNPEDKGPVADARRELAKGNFMDATKSLEKMVSDFDKLDQKQKDDAVKQMQQMAQQLQQMAGDPKKQQEQLQQQLQQLGANQQQAQQMAQQMQQAAQGDKQAQQQLQQQAQQMMQQMNNGQGPNQQQQQQIQQMMQQMQAQANANAGAQQMQQAAQQMAQAIAQAAQGQQPNQGQQQAGGQQMQQAAQQMQQQMQQMEAAAQDAAQVAAAQQQMQEAAREAQGNCNGGQAGDPGGEIEGRKDGAGQWAAGDPNGRFGAGLGGPGQGAGGRAKNSQAPFGVKQQVSPTQDNGTGRILAINTIKDNNPNKGKSTISMKEAAEAAQKEAADEVDSERISKAAQNAVKNYFNSMEKEASAPAPAPENKEEKK